MQKLPLLDGARIFLPVAALRLRRIRPQARSRWRRRQISEAALARRRTSAKIVNYTRCTATGGRRRASTARVAAREPARGLVPAPGGSGERTRSRTGSPTSGLVTQLEVSPSDRFAAFGCLLFLEPPPAPLPSLRPLFVPVLGPPRTSTSLVDAWRRAALRPPGAQLHIVGWGSRADVRRAARQGGFRGRPTGRRHDPQEVAAALDEATVLVCRPAQRDMAG